MKHRKSEIFLDIWVVVVIIFVSMVAGSNFMEGRPYWAVIDILLAGLNGGLLVWRKHLDRRLIAAFKDLLETLEKTLCKKN